MSKLGACRIELHRPLEGTIKTVTLRRSSTGKWYACLSTERETRPLESNGKAVGVDVGLSTFATLSTGEKIANPRFFRRDEKDVARAQRKLRKEEKGTPERAKRRTAVAHIHERIANRRKDFAHKVSRRLVNDFGVIAFEDLSIVRMLGNHKLAKSIADAAWGQLIEYTRYKAVDAGSVCVLVDPRGTSQRCSRCGSVVKKTLSERVHTCPVCGLVMDRDENAAVNIRALGLQSMGAIP